MNKFLDIIKHFLLPNICFYKYEDYVIYDEYIKIPKQIRWEASLMVDVYFYTYIYSAVLTWFGHHHVIQAYYWLFMMNTVFWVSAMFFVNLKYKKKFGNTE